MLKFFTKTPIAPAPDTIDELDKCVKLVYDNAQLNILVEKLLEKNAAKEEKARIDNAAKEEKARIDNTEKEEKAKVDNAAKENEKRKYSDDINKAHIKLSGITTPIENIIQNKIKEEIYELRNKAMYNEAMALERLLPERLPPEVRQPEELRGRLPPIKRGGKKKSSKKKNSNKEKKVGKKKSKKKAKQTKKAKES